MDSQVVDFEWACSGECNQCSRLNYSAEDDLLTWNIMILILSAAVCHLWMMGNITISAVYFHNPVHFDSVLQIPRCVPRAPTSGDVRVTPLNLISWNAIFLHRPTSKKKWWFLDAKKSCWSKKLASLTYAWGTEVDICVKFPAASGVTFKLRKSTKPRSCLVPLLCPKVGPPRVAPVLPFQETKSSGLVSLNIKLGLKLTGP